MLLEVKSLARTWNTGGRSTYAILTVCFPHLATLIMLPNCTFIKLQSIPFTKLPLSVPGPTKTVSQLQAHYTWELFKCSPLHIWKNLTIKTGEYVTPTIIYIHRAIQHAQAEKPAIDPFFPHILAVVLYRKCWLFSQHNTFSLTLAKATVWILSILLQ